MGPPQDQGGGAAVRGCAQVRAQRRVYHPREALAGAGPSLSSLKGPGGLFSRPAAATMPPESSEHADGAEEARESGVAAREMAWQPRDVVSHVVARRFFSSNTPCHAP